MRDYLMVKQDNEEDYDTRIISLNGRTVNLVGLRPHNLRTIEEADELYYQMEERIISIDCQLDKEAGNRSADVALWRIKAGIAKRYAIHAQNIASARQDEFKRIAKNANDLQVNNLLAIIAKGNKLHEQLMHAVEQASAVMPNKPKY